MDRALLVTVGLYCAKDNLSTPDQARELHELAVSAGAQVIDELVCERDVPTPNLYIGKGKAEEVRELCAEKKVTTVIFNNDLSGTQQRNLEAVVGIKTIDRTQLILDIFARQAKTPEGKMQVELAQLEYLLPRLTGKGVILSRLGGGIGTRGPGEQKLEVDRRRIRERVIRLKQELRVVSQRRQTLRKKRRETSVPVVTLIGYTSAGKSTLLNALAQSSQPVSHHLFTTLDPLSRSITLANNQKVVMIDTVGFINDLPAHLIEAFKATLEDVIESDLLVHVLDVSDMRVHEHNAAVWNILAQLQSMEKPLITALNKIDALSDPDWIEKYKRDFSDSIAISALKRQNLDGLLSRIQEKLAAMVTPAHLEFPLKRMDLVDLVYREGQVISINYSEDSIQIQATLPSITASKLSSYIVHN